MSDRTAELHVTAAWIEALQACWSVARAQRTATLNRRPLKRYDDRGLDVYSTEVGRVQCCESLIPDLALAGFDPILLRREAEKDADREFRAQILEQAA